MFETQEGIEFLILSYILCCNVLNLTKLFKWETADFAKWKLRVPMLSFIGLFFYAFVIMINQVSSKFVYFITGGEKNVLYKSFRKYYTVYICLFMAVVHKFSTDNVNSSPTMSYTFLPWNLSSSTVSRIWISITF